MPQRIVIQALFLIWSAPIFAEQLICEDTGITVTAESAARAQEVCTVAAVELADLLACNIPVPMPLEIRVTNDLPDECFGQYHKGKALIELRDPCNMAETLPADSPFQNVSSEGLFASVIAHELTHAGYDAVPCPFANCWATAEYLAHAMQLRSLSDTDIGAWMGSMSDPGAISRDAINTMILLMDPNKFAQKSYLHLAARPDSCGYVKLIMQGNIVFDREPL